MAQTRYISLNTNVNAFFWTYTDRYNEKLFVKMTDYQFFYQRLGRSIIQTDESSIFQVMMCMERTKLN